MSVPSTNGVQIITADDARRLTDRIKVAVEATWQLIVEAYESRAWAALGYSSWDDYCLREFGASRLRLPREDRQEVVASLTDAGLSTRAIASATGLNRRTVMKDQRQVVQNAPPESASFLCDTCAEEFDRAVWECPDCQHHWSVDDKDCRNCWKYADTTEPEVSEPPAPPSRTTGIDGKSYPRPALPPTAKQKRKPLMESVDAAGWELRRAVERLERLSNDDRFSLHRDQVAAYLRGHLEYTVEVCQDLLGQFPINDAKET